MKSIRRIFLTGGTGFIGSYLLQKASDAGIAVRALRRAAASRTRIELSSEPEWVEGELDRLDAGYFKDCDALVHLASPGVSPQKATYTELIYWNVLAFEKMLDTATSAGVKRFIIAGSFAEYGKAADAYEFIPSDCCLAPATSYAASKAAAWMVAHAFATERQIELAWLRIFSAYGDGQHEANFWPAMKAAAEAGEDFRMSPGEQIRDYIKVGRVAEVLLKAATELSLQPGVPAQYNIGSGNPVSMKDFAGRFWKEWEAPGSLLVGAIPYRPNEVMRSVPHPASLIP